MRSKRFHGLKRIKIRQSWSKYNLYNLSRLKGITPTAFRNTHYRQKFSAKSVTRAYHGEQIPEKQWERMFSTKIRSVIPMDYTYLAMNDGSEQARGRGSGLDTPFSSWEDIEKKRAETTLPYMHMTFAPIERRLDSAIFRAMFASSARQARQFVVHGHVKVNGQRMRYPGYLLNPGDMFQVDTDSVMFATGATKTAEERRASRIARRKAGEIKTSAEDQIESTEEPAEDAKPSESEEVTEGEVEPEVKRRGYKTSLKELLKSAKDALEDRNLPPSAKQKQSLRAFSKTVRSAMSTVNKTSFETLDDKLSALVQQLSIASKQPKSSDEAAEAAPKPKKLSESDRRELREALKEAEENPIDETKPYATPWSPRPYMSPFAFIPKYLEVNHNICAAVYLRHPVVRPGLAEVPTPFSFDLSQLAFTWYLRRR